MLIIQRNDPLLKRIEDYKSLLKSKQVFITKPS